MEESTRDVLEEWVRIITSNRGLMVVLIVLYLVGLVVSYGICRTKIFNELIDIADVVMSVISSILWPGMIVVGCGLAAIVIIFYAIGKLLDFLVRAMKRITKRMYKNEK